MDGFGLVGAPICPELVEEVGATAGKQNGSLRVGMHKDRPKIGFCAPRSWNIKEKITKDPAIITNPTIAATI